MINIYISGLNWNSKSGNFYQVDLKLISYFTNKTTFSFLDKYLLMQEEMIFCQFKLPYIKILIVTTKLTYIYLSLFLRQSNIELKFLHEQNCY